MHIWLIAVCLAMSTSDSSDVNSRAGLRATTAAVVVRHRISWCLWRIQILLGTAHKNSWLFCADVYTRTSLCISIDLTRLGFSRLSALVARRRRHLVGDIRCCFVFIAMVCQHDQASRLKVLGQLFWQTRFAALAHFKLAVDKITDCYDIDCHLTLQVKSGQQFLASRISQ